MNGLRCRVVLACLLALPALQTIAANHDFDGDGRDDVPWRHVLTGANVQWRAGDPAAYVALTGVSNLQWKIVAIGDFDGDGRADLLWRNLADGRNTIWRSAIAARQQAIAQVRDVRWHVLGTGDFDGDGRSDVLWRHPTLGHAIWPAANAAAVRRIPALQFVAIADLDGDGRDDLVWRSELYLPPSVVRFSAWSGADEFRAFDLGIVSAYDIEVWQLQAVGDFDGDGRADLFWRNLRDGRNVAWRGGSPVAAMQIVPVYDPGWQVVATGDYDGDGRSDLFWRHLGRGDASVWLAANARQGRYRGQVSTLWSVVP